MAETMDLEQIMATAREAVDRVTEEAAAKDPRKKDEYKNLLAEAADMAEGNKRLASNTTEHSYNRSIQRHNEVVGYEMQMHQRGQNLAEQERTLAGQEAEMGRLVEKLAEMEVEAGSLAEAQDKLEAARSALDASKREYQEELGNLPKAKEQITAQQDENDQQQSSIAQNHEEFAVDTLLATHQAVKGADYGGYRELLKTDVPEELTRRERDRQDKASFKRSEGQLKADEEVLDRFDASFLEFKQSIDGLFTAEEQRITGPQFKAAAEDLRGKLEGKLGARFRKEKAAQEATGYLEALKQIRSQVYKNLHVAIDNAILDFNRHQNSPKQDDPQPSLMRANPFIHGPNGNLLPENQKRGEELEELSHTLDARHKGSKQAILEYRTQMKEKIVKLYEQAAKIVFPVDDETSYQRKISSLYK